MSDDLAARVIAALFGFANDLMETKNTYDQIYIAKRIMEIIRKEVSR